MLNNDTTVAVSNLLRPVGSPSNAESGAGAHA